MSWWTSTWLPTWPSMDFSLPSGLQRRFISFALRRSLGHLLKPGQLDTQQIDSQIGSGYVQVRDLELDNDAINALIEGLPLNLHDGSIAKVTARIPWPNPLSSTIGLSLESLHLTFYVAPTAAPPGSAVPARLAESVASVAESFIHEELSAREEATLRESLQFDLDESLDVVPGGLDPFITDDEAHSDADPPGVSLFATLIERLISRFEFDAVDTKITLVHPEHASFTLTVPEIRYGTEKKESIATGETASTQPTSLSGETRTVTVSGVTVSTRCLLPPSPLPLTPTAFPSTPSHASSIHYASSSGTVTPPASPPPLSPYSDSSDMDEEAQLAMSQSIAFLPPRPVSPASTASSSMYQSAFSSSSPPAAYHFTGSEPHSRTPSPGGRNIPPTLPPALPVPPRQPELQISTAEVEDETIISFASEPITIRLTTPAPAHRPVTSPPTTSSLSEASSSSPSLSSSHASLKQPLDKETDNGRDQRNEPLRLSLSMGVIACSFRARHIRTVLDVVRLLSSHTPLGCTTSPATPSTPGSGKSQLDRIEANARTHGVVILFLPASGSASPNPTGLVDFYAHPLVPPKLPHGFVRVHFDILSVSLSISPTPSIQPATSTGRSGSTTMTGTLSLTELSAFAFQTSADGAELSASPLLITDPHLPSQYSATHVHPTFSDADETSHLPDFDVSDWTDPARRSNTAKLSTWRTKAPQQHTHLRHEASPLEQTSPRSPAIALSTSPNRTGHIPIGSSPARVGLGLAGLSSSPGRSGNALFRPHPPAVVAKFRMVSTSPVKRKGTRVSYPEDALEVEVDVAPLHAFVDLALALGKGGSDRASEMLAFMEEVATSDVVIAVQQPSNVEGDETVDSEEDDSDTPPGTPRPIDTARMRERMRAKEREKERKRLELLVLEDLDLGYDYRPPPPKKRKSQSTAKVKSWRKTQAKALEKAEPVITVRFPMIRVQVRGPPPITRSPRSGALVVDIHDLRLSPSGMDLHNSTSVKFAVDNISRPEINTRPRNNEKLLTADWLRIVIAYSLVGEEKAHALLSLGPLTEDVSHNASDSAYLGKPTGTSPKSRITAPLIRPCVHLTRSTSSNAVADTHITSLVATVDIASVHVQLSKSLVDGLQLWADDLTQLAESTFNDNCGTDTERAASRDPSLIGSRFFSKSRRFGSRGSGTESGSGSVNARQSRPPSETVVKVTVSEVAVRLLLPRQGDSSSDLLSKRPFDILASDTDLLIELKPEGRDETVITLGIMDLNINDTTISETSLPFLHLTIPRNLMSKPQSLLKLRFTSLIVPETTVKESRIKLTVYGITYNMYPDFDWATDLARFMKAPPGAFESVVPSERTQVTVKICDSSLRVLGSAYNGALLTYIGVFEFSTVIVGDSPEINCSLAVPALSFLLIDDAHDAAEEVETTKVHTLTGEAHWKAAGYALLAEISGLDSKFSRDASVTPPGTRIIVDPVNLRVHLCADTITALTALIGDLTSSATPQPEKQLGTSPRKEPEHVSRFKNLGRGMLSSLDEHAFRRLPEAGAGADMIHDDLPSNLDYLDESFGAAAGFRALEDEDLDEFDDNEFHSTSRSSDSDPGIVSNLGGETIRMLRPEGLHIIENYFDNLQPDTSEDTSPFGDTTLRLRIHNADVTLFLYDGYDWARTRRTIEEEAKGMRRKLAKIRQLVADGQTPDPGVEETNTLLFNSVYLGLEHNFDELEPNALIAAIDEELNEDIETASQSSWQTLPPQPAFVPSGKTATRSTHIRRKRLFRSKGPSIEFRLRALDAEVDQYRPATSLVSRTLVIVQNVEILDHIKTSTWKKFLTDLRADSRGNVRETDSNMVRVELKTVRPIPGHPTEEARLRAKILPLRLHVDQDALDFLKKFFSFQDPDGMPASNSDPSEGIYFQQAEVFPVDIKLDYKPRRVDYRALREGKTIELMNFFHFDGAEMTLRHITLTGISGWPRFFDLLNDLWTPDVKATQLVEVISGVAPIRSVVNVGSGVADLVLLPIAQYKKDGRVVRGLQKGTTSFVKSTAMEMIKLGAQLATGTQVILEQAEGVLGAQFKDSIMTEALQISPSMAELQLSEEDDNELISKYADQPTNVKEGVQSAYRSLKRNMNSAAQTILAVPMEVYERSGDEGPVRAVIRAVPIAVLKPMIGASEAVSKTLMGIHNSLDPNVRHENEAKYKQR